MGNLYIMLFLGLSFIIFGLCMNKKETESLRNIEKRLIEREKNIIELYEDIEGLMGDLDMLLSNNVHNAKNNNTSSFDIVSNLNNKEDINDCIKPPIDSKLIIYSNNAKISNLEPSREENVLQFKRNGMSEQEIAKKLNIGIGEVKLIIGLNDSREKIV